jgi:hypothetical protein
VIGIPEFYQGARPRATIADNAEFVARIVDPAQVTAESVGSYLSFAARIRRDDSKRAEHSGVVTSANSASGRRVSSEILRPFSTRNASLYAPAATTTLAV